MSDDLERENNRLRAQENHEQLDTSPVGCTGPEIRTMGKWLARVRKHASCVESGRFETVRDSLRYRPTSAPGIGGPRGIRTPVSALRGPTHLNKIRVFQYTDGYADGSFHLNRRRQQRPAPRTLNGQSRYVRPSCCVGRSPSHPELHLFPWRPQVQTALRRTHRLPDSFRAGPVESASGRRRPSRAWFRRTTAPSLPNDRRDLCPDDPVLRQKPAGGKWLICQR